MARPYALAARAAAACAVSALGWGRGFALLPRGQLGEVAAGCVAELADGLDLPGTWLNLAEPG